MSIPVLRTAEGWWSVTSSGRAARIDTAASSTAGLLADRDAVAAAAHRDGAAGLVDVSTLFPLSPVTVPCRVVAQMTNYSSHVRDSGMNPATVPLTFFRKTSGSISGPFDDVIRPGHVRLLDYEVEIGLVIGRTLAVGTEVTEHGLASYVAGLVVTNDVSARDVQLPKTQFYEAKSYPTFTPTGPVLLVLEDGDHDRFTDLRLRLWVNGRSRQDSDVTDMIYSPVRALRELSRFQRLDPGDLVLTGTPGGTALKAPPKPVELIGSLLPPATKWKTFFRSQARNPRYLKPGDVVEASIATPDGALDLGRQRTVIREGQ
ncbi:fumarylacetoacetate hydrolase family protein [Frankia sp. CNm7]|uniref:Fumarylacetoacetate hydrolase family protein n=1 Tax=Frankia nepalensis TaxID=1836974 RepID=A0A937UTT7_9ACTN|nr:fumarylacetoacetate hydrolase family protein [Frankia nepalensis]MBL7501965.1 fumarylacetoacetate hydrolase family protein [Frankia nepalensis]MBL7510595.1 fumarylacetoacetate hydrolase family protein [Frankia nepalensis]MBL7517335.1 fumarylacetoacetate hydrolase family protein [Frankia nepalensis]MBL7633418.1 fumarylacetoacetate hydrolase family protein [Frankia nepalensis]